MSPLSALLIILLVGSMSVAFLSSGNTFFENKVALAAVWVVLVAVVTYFSSFVWWTQRHPLLVLMGIAIACLAISFASIMWIRDKGLSYIFGIAGSTLCVSAALLCFHYNHPGYSPEETDEMSNP